MHAALRRALPAVALAATAASTGIANADTASAAKTKTIKASADARVERAHPKSHYGHKALRVKASPDVRSYIRFHVSGLKHPVTSAKLKIYPRTSSKTGFQVRGALAKRWTERGITWSKRPGVSKTITSASGPYRANKGYVTVDVTPLVKGNGNWTVVLTAAGKRAAQYRSREAGRRYAPKLVVSTDPRAAAPAAGTGATPTPATTNSAASGNASTPGSPGKGGGTSTGPAVYVSPSGNDSAAGSQGAPFKTVAKATGAVQPGGMVVLMAGTYDEDVVLSKPGTTASPTTIKANGSDVAKVKSVAFKASHTVAEGLTISGASGDGVSIASGLTDIGVRKNTIDSVGDNGVGFDKSGSYSNGVLIYANKFNNVGTSNDKANVLNVFADDVLVQDNDMTGTPNDVVDMWGDKHVYRHNNIHDIKNSMGNHNDAFQTWTGLGDGAEGKPVTNLLIEGNTISNNTGGNAQTIMSEGPGHSNWTIRNNVLNNAGNNGFILGKDGNGQGIQNVQVSNNTFVNQKAPMEFNVATTGVAANNIFWNTDGTYYLSKSAKVTADYNLAGGSTPKLSEAHGKNADPMFAGPADFHLQAGSPAINAGDNGALVPARTGDIDGTPTNGTNDVGAYEAH